MLLSKYDALFGNLLRVFLEADDGSGAGGDGGGDPPTTYTQEQLDEAAARAAKSERAKHKKRAEAKEAELTEMTQRLAALEQAIAATGSSGTDEPPDSGSENVADLRVKLQKQEKTVKDLMQDLQAQKDRAAAAEEARLQSEKSQKIKELLTEVKCFDLLAGSRFMEPIVRRDEEGDLQLELADGSYASLNKTNVEEVLPNYLKQTDVPGGAGTASGTPKRQQAQKELDAAKARLTELQERGRTNPTDGNISEFQRQQHVVRNLEREFAQLPQQ